MADAQGLGAFVSESVSRTGAGVLQDDGYLGSGVDVAIVDLGFIGLAEAIAAGELPPDTVAVDLPGSGDDPIEAGTEHGVGVAEHVADMAPGARLHCIRVSDEVDLENAAAYLRTSGVRIANHSVGWVNASYYDDTGPISEVVNASHDEDGVLWTVSAGNAARRHWRGGFASTDGDDWLDFAPGDEVMDLGSAPFVTVFLNWDQYGAPMTDLDLYVFDKDLDVVDASFGDQTAGQPPSEAVGFEYEPAEAPYGVAILRYAGPVSGVDLTLVSFDNELEAPVPAASLLDPASAHGALTVAAIDQAGYLDPDPPAQPYSSQGPTTDGRAKPDLAAPDGTSSWTYGVTGSFGTSFASPTVAGASALFLARDPALEAPDLRATLAHIALDTGAPGPDGVFGAGRLHVELRPACDDGVDNDGDGLVDVGADPGCATAADRTEGAGSGCGLGVEVLLAAPLLARRRRAVPTP